jgi:hypothetical protein
LKSPIVSKSCLFGSFVFVENRRRAIRSNDAGLSDSKIEINMFDLEVKLLVNESRCDERYFLIVSISSTPFNRISKDKHNEFDKVRLAWLCSVFGV